MSVYFRMSLDDIPKKTQYVIIDSNFVDGTNNTFSLDLRLESNTHVEDMSRVLGIKMVDFYITQVGGNDGTDTDIAKFVTLYAQKYPKLRKSLTKDMVRYWHVFHLNAISREVVELSYETNNGKVSNVKQTILIQFQLR